MADKHKIIFSSSTSSQVNKNKNNTEISFHTHQTEKMTKRMITEIYSGNMGKILHPYF